MKFQGGKFWFTAAELAELKLPGLPSTKRKVNERAAKECWALQVDAEGMPLARPRVARGGGLEYHISVLPDATRTALVRRGVAIACKPATDIVPIAQDTMWSWYSAQKDNVKAEAERRAAILAQVDALTDAGVLSSNAVPAVAIGAKMGVSTLWGWLSLVDGVPASDRLPLLAPRHKGGGRSSEIDPEIMRFVLSDWLRPEKPTFSSSYARTAAFAAEKGLSMPPEKTLKRRVDSETDPRLVTARRDGADALRQMLPAQRRSVAHLHALEIVNIDGHKFDVFVTPKGGGKPIRPVMVALQDVYSRKIVAWRLGESENAVMTRLAFADLFYNFGIPKACLLDNGRAFASKWITGGAPTRFRFKIKDGEPTGLLTALGIKTMWATPYRGQSKPIERAFRDLADVLARHPRTSGAYTGNRPDAKPENYQTAAVPWDDFVHLVDQVMMAHNGKLGRRTEMANGRSFDQVFEASYATAPIGKATADQLRYALLTGEQLRADRKSGEIRIAGNRYWAPELMSIRGKLVTVRFDPDALHGDVHVYNQAGAFLVTAQLIADEGFDNMGAAKASAKRLSDLRKAVRVVEEKEQLYTASQIAAMLPDAPEEDELPDPQVIRPVRVAHRNGAAAAVAAEPENTSFMNRFGAAVSHLRAVE